MIASAKQMFFKNIKEIVLRHSVVKKQAENKTFYSIANTPELISA